MKKMMIATLAVLTLALTIIPIAAAQTVCEEKICSMAKECENVKEAKCLVYQRIAIVAIKTEKFTTQTQYNEYVDELSKRVKTECEIDRIFVTRNPKVMKEIERLSALDETERDSAIQKLLDDMLNHPIRKINIPKLTTSHPY